MGYSPRGHKESDTTERLHFHFPGTVAGARGPVTTTDHNFELKAQGTPSFLAPGLVCEPAAVSQNHILPPL